MEVKSFTDSMFIPLMIQRESVLEEHVLAMNLEGILRLHSWVEDYESGLCYVPDIVKIEIAFDADINDYETFDYSKADVFSIVATRPKFLDDSEEPLDTDQNTNMMKNIINCFDGSMIALPKELNIFDAMFECNWTYRIAMNMRLFPGVSNGQLIFECF